MPGFTSDFSEFTILLVDDISLNLLLLQKSLSRFNFNILTAKSGREALTMMDAMKPAIVFLDVMMPGMDGLSVLRTIRRNPDYDDVRVVMISALNSEDDVDAAMKAGANDYISKPIIMSTLLNCVMKQIDEYKAQKGL